jgi:hypothetical protein
LARAPTKRAFGQIDRLTSGRYRARYSDPYGRVADDGRQQRRHDAAHTFAAKAGAEAWLVDERRVLTSGDWTSPAERLSRPTRKTSHPR